MTIEKLPNLANNDDFYYNLDIYGNLLLDFCDYIK